MAEPELDPESFRILYHHAPCGLLSTSVDGSILHVNQTLCDWLRYTSEQLVGVKRLQDLLTVGCKIFHQTHWMPLLQMQGSVAEVQLEFATRSQGTLHALVNAIRRRDEAGMVRDELAIFVATDRRKYEQELLLARKRADELLLSERKVQAELAELLRGREQDAQQRALLAEQLIGIVSHDLRTPLHAILLGASLLGSSAVNQAQSRTVQRIVSATNRANRLIADLLDFTQARLGGGLRVSIKPLDLHALVADGLDELRLAYPGRHLEHHTSGDGQCCADADRLSQVVTNLVGNALTYGATDRPITVSTAVANDELRIEVHNFGPSIPPRLLPHLFEPLRRGEQELRLGSRSVGLGLYIVQQIARSHGGEVNVRSDPETGTSFIVRAPSLLGPGPGAASPVPAGVTD